MSASHPEPSPHPHAPTAQTATGFHRFCEVASTLLFPVMCAASIGIVGVHFYHADLLWTLAFLIPLSWAASDVFTGCLHWMFDTYWTEETFFLGKAFVQPFREHHVFPKHICAHDVYSTLGNSCILGVLLQALILGWLGLVGVSSIIGGILLFISLTFAGAALTNLFHKWAHADSNPLWVRALQRSGLILPPANHDAHHNAPFDRSYCITCGWMNPVLNKIHFFRILEGTLRMMGIEPTNTHEHHDTHQHAPPSHA